MGPTMSDLTEHQRDMLRQVRKLDLGDSYFFGYLSSAVQGFLDGTADIDHLRSCHEDVEAVREASRLRPFRS